MWKNTRSPPNPPAPEGTMGKEGGAERGGVDRTWVGEHIQGKEKGGEGHGTRGLGAKEFEWGGKPVETNRKQNMTILLGKTEGVRLTAMKKKSRIDGGKGKPGEKKAKKTQ